jgi:DNA-binding transcriptional LysR family regulator
MRVLCDSPQRLVASPQFLSSRMPPSLPADLSAWPSLDWGPIRDHAWHMVGPRGEEVQVRHRPRYITDDMTALRHAALRGLGIVQLPCMVMEDDLRSGALQDVIPGWEPRGGIVHAVFPSRRGLLPAVRMLIDYMATHIGGR